MPEEKTLVAQEYDIKNPKKIQQLAKVLADFIAKQKLSVPIAGKQYVMVEGWEFAGAQLGIIPFVDSTENLSKDKEIKYQATVLLKDINKDMLIVGKGVAVCSNLEGKKKSFEEYAILSMAQTRATGKAYRNLIGWLMKVAGYEATPAEDMNDTKGETSKKNKTGISDKDLEMIKQEVLLQNTEEELMKYATKWKEYLKNPTFRGIISGRKKQFS